MMEWKCSNCGSETIQKVSVVHAGGTARLLGGIGGTALAQSLAPPSAPTRAVVGTGLGCAFALGCGGCLVGFGVAETGWWFLLPFALMLLVWIGGTADRQKEQRAADEEYAHLMQVYHEEQARWERSYLCCRCGTIFQLASREPSIGS